MSSLPRAACVIFNLFGLEHEPPADLDAARLEDVAIATRNAEVAWVVDIHVRYAEPTAIEEVEELGTNLEVGCLGDARLLKDAEVFSEERLRAEIIVCRRGVAEEHIRIGVVSGVLRTTDGERCSPIRVFGSRVWKRRRVTKIRRTRERSRVEEAVVHATRWGVGVEILTRDVRAQVAADAEEIKELTPSAGKKRHERRTGAVAVNRADLETADETINEATLIEKSLSLVPLAHPRRAAS